MKLLKGKRLRPVLHALVFRGRCGGRAAGDGAKLHWRLFMLHQACSGKRASQHCFGPADRPARKVQPVFYDWLTYSRAGERGRRAVRAAQRTLAREPGVLRCGVALFATDHAGPRQISEQHSVFTCQC